MAAERDLCFTPAVELLKLYRARDASPLEVMQAIFARIDAVNPDVNAIVTLARDDALRHARLATAAFRRGAALPPLFGVPVAIKDVTPRRVSGPPTAPSCSRVTCPTRTRSWSSAFGRQGRS